MYEKSMDYIETYQTTKPPVFFLDGNHGKTLVDASIVYPLSKGTADSSLRKPKDLTQLATQGLAQVMAEIYGNPKPVVRGYDGYDIISLWW